MPSWIDGALYPDEPVPERLDGLPERVDFLARLCASWDFGRLPDRETVDEVRKSDWRESVDACQMLTSPAYHLLRLWHGLPAKPYLGTRLAAIADDPNLEFV